MVTIIFITKHSEINNYTIQNNKFGSHVTIEGKTLKSIIVTSITPTNGIEPLIISDVGISELMPFTTNKFKPTGGVIKPASILIVIIIPNHIGSNPKPVIMSNKIGAVINMMAAGGIKKPKNNRKILIAIKTTHFEKSRPITKLA